MICLAAYVALQGKWRPQSRAGQQLRLIIFKTPKFLRFQAQKEPNHVA